ncbi:MAG: N-6 DNA methylase, partial [Pyrinomonadaceae bacterium]|nr:N-6 DNA methylase [Pyrinomonadaceae bacterium]
YATVATNLLFFTKGLPTREIWYYEHRLPENQKSYSKMKTIRVEEFQPIKDWWENRVESEIAWRVHIETIKARNYDLDIKNPHKTEDLHEYTSQEIIGLLERSLAKSSELLQKLNAETVG